MEAITPSESAELVRLESIIIRNEGAMLETAVALRTIKERKLYRSDFDSFEDYCRTRWNFTRQRGYQLIVFAEEVTMSTDVDTCPKNESEARRIRSQRKQSNRKPICDTPPRNPPPVIDAEIAREIVAEAEAKEAEAEPVRELTDFEREVWNHLDVVLADIDYVRSCITERDCNPDVLNAAAGNFSVAVKMLHRLAKQCCL